MFWFYWRNSFCDFVKIFLSLCKHNLNFPPLFYCLRENKIERKNTAQRNKKPLIYGTSDMTIPYEWPWMYTRRIILDKANVNNTGKYVVGVLMVTCLYMSFCQGQAEQQDKPNAQSQMATCLYPFIFLSSLFVFCRLCFYAYAATDSACAR